MSKYQGAIEAITAAAEMKMTLNRFKGDIEHLSPEKAVELCKLELEEYLVAVKKEDHEQSIIELADAFNFIIAMAFNAMANYQKRKS